MTSLIWATTTEVRTYLGAELPNLPESDVERAITKAVNAIERIIIRWPTIDLETGRAFDVDVRTQMIAAVSETIKARRKAETVEQALGGLAPILAAGGSISTKTLSASTTGAGGGAAVGENATRVPLDALDALVAAGLIGGSGGTW